MGVVCGCCGAASSEREGDRERAEAPSGAQLRVSIECLERILAAAGASETEKSKQKHQIGTIKGVW